MAAIFPAVLEYKNPSSVAMSSKIVVLFQRISIEIGSYSMLPSLVKLIQEFGKPECN